jgi:hypothetical protein
LIKIVENIKIDQINPQTIGKGKLNIGRLIVGFQSHQFPRESTNNSNLLFESGKNNFNAHTFPCVAQSKSI